MVVFNAPSLKGRALRYLSMREHSRFELVQKLTRFEEVPGELALVLDDLAAKGFISDLRAAESVVRRRGSRLGTRRVLYELRAKGLDAETVQAATVELKATELARAQEVWRKKFGVPPLDAAAMGKQQRFLLARGFSVDAVRKVVAGGDDGAVDGIDGVNGVNTADD